MREWIVNGLDTALVESFLTGSIAKFYLQRQAVSMPSFSAVPDEEIELLGRNVIALIGFGPMESIDVRRNGKQTSQ